MDLLVVRTGVCVCMQLRSSFRRVVRSLNLSSGSTGETRDLREGGGGGA